MSGSLLRFPQGFMWGAATSAHQVEGNNRANDWWRCEHRQGCIHEGAVSGDACRHYELFDSDFALAQMDGHNAHRMSIEWSRIAPERGHIDSAAVAHYHEVFASMRRHALTPIVTLHHFTNPLWIADHGGWEARATIDAFCEFVRFCAREYGGEVDWWCTVNEPDVYGFRSYSEGIWPPLKRDDASALCVIANMLEAHGLAYRVLHAEDKTDADGDGRAAMVGFAKHLVQLEPARWWMPLDAVRARIEDHVFNESVARAAVTGDIALSIPGVRGVKRHVPELRGAMDFFGLNYYTRWMVKATGPEPRVARPGATLNDLGWEVRAEGLALAVKRAAGFARVVAENRRQPEPSSDGPIIPGNVPILITEHGIADRTDDVRPRALVDSLAGLARAIEQGANVCGYMHWSLMDNFEWSDGYRGRFGLYAIDFDDPKRERRRRNSAEIYARITKANAIELDSGVGVVR